MLPWTAWVIWCPPVLLLSWSWCCHSLCADVLSLSCPYMSFRISMYTSSINCSCNDVNIALVCTESNAVSYSTKATHSGMLYSRHFSLSWIMACMWSVVVYLLLNPACSLGWFSSSFVSSLAVIVLWIVCTYLIALVCSSWCIFCSLSWRTSPYLLPSMF